MEKTETTVCSEHSGVCSQVSNIRYITITGLALVFLIVLSLFGWSQSEYNSIQNEQSGRFEKVEKALQSQQAIKTDMEWLKMSMKQMDSKINHRTEQIQESIKELTREMRKNNNH